MAKREWQATPLDKPHLARLDQLVRMYGVRSRAVILHEWIDLAFDRMAVIQAGLLKEVGQGDQNAEDKT
ncbi:MAG TPA: hypothetical protein VJ793_00545 [Anaerolineae bacterium]|nr:hypothetical protein [Anaerolineae bacterium]